MLFTPFQQHVSLFLCVSIYIYIYIYNGLSKCVFVYIYIYIYRDIQTYTYDTFVNINTNFVVHDRYFLSTYFFWIRSCCSFAFIVYGNMNRSRRRYVDRKRLLCSTKFLSMNKCCQKIYICVYIIMCV